MCGDDGTVAGDVIRIVIGVDQKPHRARREPGDGRQDLLALSRGPRVDEQHSLVPDLRAHVAARANNHVHLALHVKDFDLVNDDRWWRGSQRHQDHWLLRTWVGCGHRQDTDGQEGDECGARKARGTCLGRPRIPSERARSEPVRRAFA